MKKLFTILTVGLLLLSGTNAFASVAVDPAYGGMSARPLGMGKAYLAFAEDADAVFVNPAGLANANTVKLTSMYTNLMGDVKYVVLGGVYPIKGYGVFGAGLINTGVDGIPLTDADNNSLGNGSWNNSVFLVSYGNDLGNVNSALNGVKVGTSVKFYSQTGAGNASVEAGNGSGTDMDLGIMYSPNWITLAAVGTNILPGAKVNQDSLVSTLKLGTRLNLLGDSKALYQSNNGSKFNLDIDCDTKPTIADSPIVWHVGGEYWTNENLALRLGVDQNVSKSETINNLTAGLGYRKDGVEFDYAYNSVGSVADDPTHYFSIAFVGRDKPVVASKPKTTSVNEIMISKPNDKDTIYSNTVTVSGQMQGNLASLKVNGEEVMLDGNNFQTVLKLDKYGVQEIKAEAIDQNGNVLSKSIQIMRLASFDDVTGDHWAKVSVEKVTSAGILNGYPDGTFKPEKILTRAEMATIIARMKKLPMDETVTSSFKDVKSGYWGLSAIEAVKAEGLMIGTKNKKNQMVFNPDKPITRAEGIAILVRMDGLVVDTVKGKNWAMPYIASATDAGMLSTFTQHQDLVSNKGLTRAELCSMLVNTQTAGKIFDLKLGMR